MSKKCYIDGIQYKQVAEASIKLNIKYSSILYRLKSDLDRFKSYYYEGSVKTTRAINNQNVININSRKCQINGVEYDSINAAAEKLSIKNSTIRDRIKSNNELFSSYFFTSPSNKKPPRKRK